MWLSDTEHWRRALGDKLPGEQAQEIMAPEFRGEFSHDSDPLPAAVMILLYPRGKDTNLAFIKRNSYDGPHSAQVSFPGGVWEQGDSSLEETAVRETREELGIAGEIHLLGPLTRLHIPVSNFIVTPFAGWMDQGPEFHPDPSEVQYVIESSLDDLLDMGNIRSGNWSHNDRSVIAPYYRVGKEKIWGATAMMLCEFLQVAARLR